MPVEKLRTKEASSESAKSIVESAKNLIESTKNILSKLKHNVVEYAEKVFGGITLSKNKKYEVPGITNKPKSINHKEFPGVKFGNCRLSRQLGSVVYPDSLVVAGGKQWKEAHKETFYSQKVLPGGGLKIPGRHIAEDGTIRDGDGFICVAANYIPKGSQIMTTLGPGKVYDTGHMKGKHIDIYTNW